MPIELSAEEQSRLSELSWLIEARCLLLRVSSSEDVNTRCVEMVIPGQRVTASAVLAGASTQQRFVISAAAAVTR